MNVSINEGLRVEMTRLEKVCQDCSRRDGEIDSDGTEVKVKEFEGDLLCDDCLEALAYVQRWV